MTGNKDFDLVVVEFYIGTRLLSGRLTIVAGRRLLDLLNKLGDLDGHVQSDYIEFISDAVPVADTSHVRYVHKSSVDFAALPGPDLARGAGVTGLPGVYPRVDKVKTRVALEMAGYSMEGYLHSAPGRTVRDTLDEKTLFLPMTDATILRDNHFYGTRPFVAVRKDQVILLDLVGPALVGATGVKEVWR